MINVNIGEDSFNNIENCCFTGYIRYDIEYYYLN